MNIKRRCAVMNFMLKVYVKSAHKSSKSVHDDKYVAENCAVCCAAMSRCGPQDVRRLSVLEGSDGFHLSDAMFFCRRGMEVVPCNMCHTTVCMHCIMYGIDCRHGVVVVPCNMCHTAVCMHCIMYGIDCRHGMEVVPRNMCHTTCACTVPYCIRVWSRTICLHFTI